MFSIFAFYGVEQPTLEIDTIGDSVVSENAKSPSQKAGLVPGDKIISFNNIEISTWSELVSLIEVNPNQIVSIGYIRNNQKYITTTTLESRIISDKSYGYLGVSPSLVKSPLQPIEAITATTKVELEMTKAAFQGIITLVSPENLQILAGTYKGENVPDEVRPLSPIGLAQAGSQIADSGLVNLFSLLAFVNIFLAVFNSIPLVPLDGGRIMLALFEGVTGKKVSDKKLYPIAAFVVLLFIFLGFTAFYLDITQPIQL